MNPLCGHRCQITCAEAHQLGQPPLMQPCQELWEGQVQPFPVTLPRGMIKCNVEVTVHRSCGHQQTMSCKAAHRTLSCCIEPVVMRSSLCGHATTKLQWRHGIHGSPMLRQGFLQHLEVVQCQ